MASVPEPPPLNHGKSVTSALLEWMETRPSRSYDGIDWESGKKLIKERREFGLQKYGQELMTKDGRNTIEDARQELGDLLQYLFKAKMCGEDITPVTKLLPILNELCMD